MTRDLFPTFQFNTEGHHVSSHARRIVQGRLFLLGVGALPCLHTGRRGLAVPR